METNKVIEQSEYPNIGILHDNEFGHVEVDQCCVNNLLGHQTAKHDLVIIEKSKAREVALAIDPSIEVEIERLKLTQVAVGDDTPLSRALKKIDDLKASKIN